MSSALDRIRRVTLLDVKPGDVLLLEIEAGVFNTETGVEESLVDRITEAIREELERVGHSPDEIGILVTTRESVSTSIIRATPPLQEHPPPAPVSERSIRADVVCYCVGIVNASVCAPLDLAPNEVADEVNRQHPTGVGPWKISEEETFHTGQPHPCGCDVVEGRQHWLLSC